MDRRSLLAIVLSTAVILLFQFYLFPKPKPSPRATIPAGDTTGGSPVVRADSFAFDTGTPALRQAPGASVSTFPARIDGIDARFTTQGGGLESWRLTAFKGPTGEPVDMVRRGPEPHVTLLLGAETIDLSDGLFLSTTQETPGGGQVINFTGGEPGGLQVTKTFRIQPGNPLVDFEVSVTGLPTDAREAWLEVAWGGGLPQAEKIARNDQQSFGAILSLGKDIQRIPAARFNKEPRKTWSGVVNWVAARNKYFMAGLVPEPGTVTGAVATGKPAEHWAGAGLRYALTGAGQFHQSMRIYLGPLDYWKLKDVHQGLERSVDLGWKVLLPVSQLLLSLLNMGYRLIPNYGIVIILLSALTKIIFYPLTRSGMKSMRAMQEIQPEMERLRKKYADDPNRLNQEVFGLYKKHNINPVGGCLPLLLQMPVFFALYTVLANSVALRQAPFMLWIDDLSSPDVLFRAGNFGIHLLPLLMSATMFWQQKITPSDPRQASLMYLTPVMMLFFLYSVPSGLSLYWTVVNILSVAQQYIINRERALEPVRAG